MTHTEAKGIAFCSLWRVDGGKINLTERADSSVEAGEELLISITHFEKEHGFMLAPDFSKVVKSAPSMTTYNPPDEHTLHPAPTDRNGDVTPLTIQVSNIKLSSGGEHPRWVVQGGNFKKFGITCWPETLEEAGLKDKLDPLSDNLPEGQWLAYYTEDDKQRPDKVTRLVRQ